MSQSYHPHRTQGQPWRRYSGSRGGQRLFGPSNSTIPEDVVPQNNAFGAERDVAKALQPNGYSDTVTTSMFPESAPRELPGFQELGTSVTETQQSETGATQDADELAPIEIGGESGHRNQMALIRDPDPNTAGSIHSFNDPKVLDDNFKQRKKPAKFFVVGRVFLTPWTEPAGSSGSNDGSISTVRWGQFAHTTIRRFVVVRERRDHCLALPIHTYGGRGVSKHGLQKSEHGVIYSTPLPPSLLAGETPTRIEAPMQVLPIHVRIERAGEELDPVSRINYAKVHTLEHNLKVRNLGNVSDTSMKALLGQFLGVFSAGVSGGA